MKQLTNSNASCMELDSIHFFLLFIYCKHDLELHLIAKKFANKIKDETEDVILMFFKRLNSKYVRVC